MIEWTSAQRHAPYKSYPKTRLKQLQTQQQQSMWHLNYHIQPQSGLLNDPNGFAYFNNRWQLFYQNFPYGPVHGLKSWRHVSSSDLVHWHRDSLSLNPSAPYSRHGVYSGSALPIDDRLFLFYTGNVRTPDGRRVSTQLGAWVDKQGQLTKLPEPLITCPKGYTAHFRDPQLLFIDGSYYVLIGAQRQDQKGQILLYHAEDVQGPWQLIGPLDFGYQDLGYMIECPNLAFVDGKVVLLFCPQGLDRQSFSYTNIYPNMYIVADDIDWKHGKLLSPGPLTNLDLGFDCYATQIVNGPNQHTYAVSWLGLPETYYPSDKEGWQGCLSLIKRLTIKNNRLCQFPVSIPTTTQPFDIERDTLTFNEVLTFDMPRVPNTEVKLGNTEEYLSLHFKAQSETLTIDRGQAGEPIETEYGTSRTLKLGSGRHRLTLYLDRSSFELFIDDGQQVASGRIFPHCSSPWHVQSESNVNLKIKVHRIDLSHS